MFSGCDLRISSTNFSTGPCSSVSRPWVPRRRCFVLTKCWQENKRTDFNKGQKNVLKKESFIFFCKLTQVLFEWSTESKKKSLQPSFATGSRGAPAAVDEHFGAARRLEMDHGRDVRHVQTWRSMPCFFWWLCKKRRLVQRCQCKQAQHPQSPVMKIVKLNWGLVPWACETSQCASGDP